jgi:hypothetical protein
MMNSASCHLGFSSGFTGMTDHQANEIENASNMQLKKDIQQLILFWISFWLVTAPLPIFATTTTDAQWPLASSTSSVLKISNFQISLLFINLSA